MAVPPKILRHVCTECGNVSEFKPGQDVVCPHCGRPADVPLGAEGPVSRQPKGQPAAPAQPPPTGLAVAALVLGFLAAASFFVFPLALLFGLAALACGIVALTRNDGDSGVQVMASLGVGLGALALLFILFLLPFWISDEPGSSAEFSSSGQTYDDGGSGGSSGNGGSDGGGGSSNDGGPNQGGGSSGGSDAGNNPPNEPSQDSPTPTAILSGLVLLAAAGWRRRF